MDTRLNWRGNWRHYCWSCNAAMANNKRKHLWYPLYTLFKVILSCRLGVTLVAVIAHTFRFRFSMFCQVILCCSLKVTLVTCILDTFMFRLNMSFRMTLCCSLIVTLITSVLASLYRLNMSCLRLPCCVECLEGICWVRLKCVVNLSSHTDCKYTWHLCVQFKYVSIEGSNV